jgi:hypothetical protein
VLLQLQNPLRSDVRFPDDFRLFLRTMNGTDRGISVVEDWDVVNAYPRDLSYAIALIADLKPFHDWIVEACDLDRDVAFVPIYQRRYVVCSSNPADSRVCSIFLGGGSFPDAIVFGESLREYLMTEFLGIKSRTPGGQ